MKNLLAAFAIVLMFGSVASEAEAARCQAELRNGRGRLLETFRGFGYDRMEACQDATRQCRRVRKSGYYRARVQTCEIVRPRRQVARRSCTAHMYGPRGGRIFQSFRANASGPRRTGVKAQACRRALRQCEVAKRRSGRVRAICRAERGRGAYDFSF